MGGNEQGGERHHLAKLAVRRRLAVVMDPGFVT